MKRKLFFKVLVLFLLYGLAIYFFDIPLIEIANAQEPPYDVQQELLKEKIELEKLEKMAEKAAESLPKKTPEEKLFERRLMAQLVKSIPIMILMAIFFPWSS